MRRALSTLCALACSLTAFAGEQDQGCVRPDIVSVLYARSSQLKTIEPLLRALRLPPPYVQTPAENTDSAQSPILRSLHITWNGPKAATIEMPNRSVVAQGQTMDGMYAGRAQVAERFTTEASLAALGPTYQLEHDARLAISQNGGSDITVRDELKLHMQVLGDGISAIGGVSAQKGASWLVRDREGTAYHWDLFFGPDLEVFPAVRGGAVVTTGFGIN